MKTNEFLDEGLLDFTKKAAAGIGGAATGGVVGANAGWQQKTGQIELQQLANKVVTAWNKYSGGTGDTDITSWTAKYFNCDKNLLPPAPESLSPANANKYLTDVTKLYKMGKLDKQAAQTRQQPTQNQQQDANQADEPITINGQKLDPKNPKEKAIIDQIKAQQQSATVQQSTGTNTPPTTAADGDAQQADAGLPDISNLTPEERAELRRQLQASMAAK
jgi:hypothetical protein